MMISPESYYEEHLKGKTKEEIMTTIRGIKQEIGRLKNSLENPYADKKTVIKPSKDNRIYWNREYLDMAKQAYVEAGGIYNLSKAEKKIADFDANVNAIFKITFNIGGYFGGYRTYIVLLSDELKAYTKLWEVKEPLLLLDDNDEPYTKNIFVAALKELHISEWRRHYTTGRFAYTVLDGTQWELEFKYSDGHKAVVFEGDNSYPYNFNTLRRLFGIDVIERDQDEDTRYFDK